MTHSWCWSHRRSWEEKEAAGFLEWLFFFFYSRILILDSSLKAVRFFFPFTVRFSWKGQSEKRKKSELFQLCFLFQSVHQSAPSICVRNGGEKYLRCLRIITRNNSRDGESAVLFFLDLHKDFLFPQKSLVCGGFRVYFHTKPSWPHVAPFNIIFLSRKWSDERRGGEDEHVLRVLFFLNLYQLSSLEPSRRAKHKRLQSLRDILFSPSLNTLYHNPGPTQLHSLLDIQLHPAVAGGHLSVGRHLHKHSPSLQRMDKWIRQTLTRFSPATGSTFHLLRVPAAAVMQDNPETQIK